MLRSQIVTIKGVETVIGSLIIAAVGVISSTIAGDMTWVEAGKSIANSSLSFVPLGLVATGLYFVFPARIVMLVLYGVGFVGLKAVSAFAGAVLAYPFWIGYELALTAGLTVGAVALLTSGWAWESNASPTEA
jgi:hypothetical protein